MKVVVLPIDKVYVVRPEPLKTTIWKILWHLPSIQIICIEVIKNLCGFSGSYMSWSSMLGWFTYELCSIVWNSHCGSCVRKTHNVHLTLHKQPWLEQWLVNAKLEHSPCVSRQPKELKHVKLVHSLIDFSCLLQNIGKLQCVHAHVKLHILSYVLKSVCVNHPVVYFAVPFKVSLKLVSHVLCKGLITSFIKSLVILPIRSSNF